MKEKFLGEKIKQKSCMRKKHERIIITKWEKKILFKGYSLRERRLLLFYCFYIGFYPCKPPRVTEGELDDHINFHK